MTGIYDHEQIERVREADAEAEAAWERANEPPDIFNKITLNQRNSRSLIAIAAELRAQRISRRPGAGQ